MKVIIKSLESSKSSTAVDSGVAFDTKYQNLYNMSLKIANCISTDHISIKSSIDKAFDDLDKYMIGASMSTSAEPDEVYNGLSDDDRKIVSDKLKNIEDMITSAARKLSIHECTMMRLVPVSDFITIDLAKLAKSVSRELGMTQAEVGIKGQSVRICCPDEYCYWISIDNGKFHVTNFIDQTIQYEYELIDQYFDNLVNAVNFIVNQILTQHNNQHDAHR